MRDIVSNLTVVRGASQTLSGATPNNSAAFDRRGYSALTIYLESLTVTDAGTADGFTMKLQHSDTLVGSSFVDVPATGVLNDNVALTADTDDDKIIGGIGYVGKKRYVRAVFTGTAGTDAVVRALGVLGKPFLAPCPQVGATVATT